MQQSIEQFLDQVARRGSWMGGGSVAALGAALAAALLEKLVVDRRVARKLRAARRESLALIERDARRFARVIAATRAKDARAFRAALKRATDVPCRIFEHAQAIERECRKAKRAVKPRFQSDLQCASSVAAAAAASAQALIRTNLAWLRDPAYSARVRRRLQAAAHAR